MTRDISIVEETPVFMEMEGATTPGVPHHSPRDDYHKGANGLEPKPPYPSSKYREGRIESTQEDHCLEGIDPSSNHEASVNAMQA